jgi:5'-deoxynucleotidase YfbR-like HD superfamily hydrolase
MLFTDAHQISEDDIRRDVDAIFWSMRLSAKRRYFHQRFWEAETQAAEYASRIEPVPRLESVAEHSWHVADMILLLAPHFGRLDVHRCLILGLMHDKMEITTGDKNPVGRDGTGTSTHAFSTAKRFEKDEAERAAIADYVARLRPSARSFQAGVLSEVVEGETLESRFVKAVDKLQSLAFIITKKKGNLGNKHLRFTIRYSSKALHYFPDLAGHYSELKSRLFADVARYRGIQVAHVEEIIVPQPVLFADAV